MKSLIASLGALLPSLMGKQIPYQQARRAGYAILALIVLLLVALVWVSYAALT